MELLIALGMLTALFWVGFHLTGAILSAFFWLMIKLPIAAVLFSFGLACCATLILIPVGLKLFGAAGRVLF